MITSNAQLRSRLASVASSARVAVSRGMEVNRRNDVDPVDIERERLILSKAELAIVALDDGQTGQVRKLLIELQTLAKGG